MRETARPSVWQGRRQCQRHQGPKGSSPQKGEMPLSENLDLFPFFVNHYSAPLAVMSRGFLNKAVPFFFMASYGRSPGKMRKVLVSTKLLFPSLSLPPPAMIKERAPTLFFWNRERRRGNARRCRAVAPLACCLFSVFLCFANPNTKAPFSSLGKQLPIGASSLFGSRLSELLGGGGLCAAQKKQEMLKTMMAPLLSIAPPLPTSCHGAIRKKKTNNLLPVFYSL